MPRKSKIDLEKVKASLATRPLARIEAQQPFQQFAILAKPDGRQWSIVRDFLWPHRLLGRSLERLKNCRHRGIFLLHSQHASSKCEPLCPPVEYSAVRLCGPLLVDASHDFLGPSDRVGYGADRRGHLCTTVVLSQFPRSKDAGRYQQNALAPLIHVQKCSTFALYSP